MWNRQIGKIMLKYSKKITIDLILSTIESLVGKYFGINPSRANYRQYVLDLVYLQYSIRQYSLYL